MSKTGPNNAKTLSQRVVYQKLEDVIGCKWSVSVLMAVRQGVARPGALKGRTGTVKTYRYPGEPGSCIKIFQIENASREQHLLVIRLPNYRDSQNSVSCVHRMKWAFLWFFTEVGTFANHNRTLSIANPGGAASGKICEPESAIRNGELTQQSVAKVHTSVKTRFC